MAKTTKKDEIKTVMEVAATEPAANFKDALKNASPEVQADFANKAANVTKYMEKNNTPELGKVAELRGKAPKQDSTAPTLKGPGQK